MSEQAFAGWDSEYEIHSESALRTVIGEEIPGLAEKNIDHLNEFAKDYVAKSPFLVLCTADARGNMDASPKGDAPGFVQIVDNRTLLIPDRPGNKLAYGHRNIIANSKVGLIFMIPGTPETLRVNGEGVLTADPKILEQLGARGKPAMLALKVDVREVFFHCAKAFIRSNLWRHEQWPEKHRVSFGEMLAAQRGEKPEVAQAIDQFVEEDYKNNL